MKKSKGLIIGLIAALVLIGGGAAAYFFMTNTPKNAYLLSEKKSMDNMSKYVEMRFPEESKFQQKLKDESYASNLKLGVDVPENLTDGLGVSKSMIDSSNIILDLAHNGKEKKSKISLTPTIADNDIGAFTWSADKDNQYLDAPVLDKPLNVPNNKIVDTLEKLNPTLVEEGMTNESLNLNNILSGATISEEDVNKIAERYIKIVVDSVKDENFKKDKEKVSVFGKNMDLDKLTMHLKREDVKKVVLAVLEEAKDDKELQELLKSQNQGKDVKQEIEKLIKDAKKEEVKNYPEINSIIYVDGKDILKRDLTIKGQDDKDVRILGSSQINDNLKLDYHLSAGDEEILIVKGESKKSDKKFEDSYQLLFNDSEEKEVSFTNVSTADGGKRNDKGTVDLTQLAGSDMVLNFNNEMNTDIGNNEQKQKAEVSFDVEGEAVKILLDSNTKLKQDFKVAKKDARNLNTMSDSELSDLQTEVEDKFDEIFSDVTQDFE
ncbi:DUF6583 family protein [Macrococcus psychrotolerans]|nr:MULTISPECIES: DUF6583 family protein [Macrococcus]QYA32968.1 hypothetical protein KYI10_00505 [Macrococcus sp. 19Msa1099]QYA37779.1 hypothetical protein KYI07_00500 [Macrococcus caseolyticus]QYA76486.1 hypothetical protein KYI12_00500 [Macrococcus caseolyticus]